MTLNSSDTIDADGGWSKKEENQKAASPTLALSVDGGVWQ